MLPYLYETHVHSSEVSRCGHVGAADVVRRYIDAGYNGLVLTDHINHSTFRNMPDAPWDEKVTHFLEGWRRACETAAALCADFSVLLGAELRLDGADNDYLLFGVDAAFLRAHPDLMQMEFAQMADCVHDAGLLLVQAHPFREDMTIVDWKKLDGVEAFNGNPGHESNNPIAEAWAERHGLLKTSGNDYHGDFGEKLGGIRTDEPIRDNAALLDALKSGRYELAQKE
ncbi:MAG: hypothetical protein IJT44_07390 [Clostridia bacterium]|nr:hypothetical protein [Clostridia bacterium]